jgi:type VI secretion system protein ImpH
VANATGMAVRVRQFVPRMIPIHEQDRTCLGRANSTLKSDALCGSRVCDVMFFFVVELGPMSWKQYLAFQPRSHNLALVRKLIMFIVGLEYEFDLHLILKGPEIPCQRLGGGRRATAVLGRTVLLRRPHKVYSRDIVIKETAAKI